jgi:hypothetical protein
MNGSLLLKSRSRGQSEWSNVEPPPLWSCEPAIHLRHSPRSSEHVALERHHPECGLRDQRIDLTVDVAATSNAAAPPKWIQPVLQLRYPRFGAAPMFEKDVSSRRPENPAYFGQRGQPISDRAKSQGRHHAVEPARWERQVLAGLLDALNGKARCRNPLGNLRREHFLGVEGPPSALRFVGGEAG